MRVAIVHYWLLGMRGGERVVEELCRLFPGADLFTLFYNPDCVSDTIRSHRVTASYLDPLRRFHRSLLPLMPHALSRLDLRGYDLVISSESGPAKGVAVSPGARHICYVHTPMRYLWDLYPRYVNGWTPNPIKRAALRASAPYLRRWDVDTASRVDQIVANSENVRTRIRNAWSRESTVVYPPVDTGSFFHAACSGGYLIVSELVAYKQIDYAVRAFTRAGLPLRIVGDGPEYRALRSQAGPCIEFCGRVTESDLRAIYSTCRALIMPGEEDFGMVAVEALASGKPVIALGRGGVVESVPRRDPIGGVFYYQAGEAPLLDAIAAFEAIESSIDPRGLQQWAAQFSNDVFRSKIQSVLAAGAQR